MTGENDPGFGKTTAAQTLRKWAEAKVAGGDKPFKDMSAFEMSTLIHELRIHQVELEMQNEELRKSQAETERSRKAYQDLWELSPVGYLVVEFSGRVTAVNRAAQRLFGRPEKALLKARFSTLVAPESQVPVHLMFERALESEITEKQEIRILKPDGASRICLMEIRSLGGEPGREQIQAILTDITQQKRAEDDLKKKEQEKIAILDSLVEHVVYQDRKKKILWANRAACDSVQMKREDLLGRYCHEIWADRRTPCEDCPVTRACDTNQPQWFEKMTPDGRWWYIQGHQVRYHNGHVMGMIEITLDITDRKRAEETLRKAKDELELRVEQRTTELVEVNEKLRQEIEKRDRAEKNLHETKNLLSNTFNAIQDMVTVIDKDFRVNMSNWKGHDYISEKDRRGHPFCYEVIMHRKKPCNPCHAMEVFAAGETKQLEATNPIDGKIRDIRMFPMLDDKGKVVAVIEHLRDITELKQSEEALRESEEKYRQLFENESDAVMIFNAETLRFEDANRATLDLFGYSKEEFLTLTVADVSVEKEKTRLAVKKVKSGGLDSKFVLLRYFRKKDGSVFPGEINAGKFISGGRKKIIGAVRDITERMNAQEDLRKSEKRYRDLFNSIPIGLYRTTPEGSILDVNPAMLDILGYSDRDGLLQLKSLETYVDPDDREQFQHLLEEQGFVHDFTVRLHRYDGRRIWVTINTTIVHDTESQITYYEGAMADISDRKASEEQIHQLSQQLLQAQEDERQMISRELHDRVAQDLYTLLIGLNTLFDHHPNVTPEVRKKALEFSEMLQGTIRVVRDLSYELHLPDLEDMGLIAALFMYCEEFGEKSGLKVDFQATGMSALRIDCDTEMNLYRMIQEGLNNIRRHAAASQATVKLVGTHPNIILRIEDDGIGFDVKERLRTADSEKRMGLRSMAERVRLIQGDMQIRSQPKKGTRIFIKFPYQAKRDD